MRSAFYIAPFVAAVFAQEDMDSSATTTVSCPELHAFILAIDIDLHG